ncbi:MAG: hypothetical protein JKY52_18715 [Flavobacteriales bacterium]|nr:hypothetical protein [Flavobacteriales bacterium]
MEHKMLEKDFDVQSIGINENHRKVFEYIANPENLPSWTKAFSRADSTSATMVTPNGELNIAMKTEVSQDSGTVDWIMTMPDGSVGKAHSRISENGKSCIYTFVLLAPPVPLEELEGALSAQKLMLAEELVALKNILEAK